MGSEGLTDQRPESSQMASPDGQNWRCLCRVFSCQLGAAEGSEWPPGWLLPVRVNQG